MNIDMYIDMNKDNYRTADLGGLLRGGCNYVYIDIVYKRFQITFKYKNWELSHNYDREKICAMTNQVDRITWIAFAYFSKCKCYSQDVEQLTIILYSCIFSIALNQY
jgi:hypothetical protein